MIDSKKKRSRSSISEAFKREAVALFQVSGVSRNQYYAWIERGRESTYATLARRLLVLIQSTLRE